MKNYNAIFTLIKMEEKTCFNELYFLMLTTNF